MADPGSSVFCPGEGQIQPTHAIRINEGSWTTRTVGSMDADGTADALRNVSVHYRDLEGETRSWPELDGNAPWPKWERIAASSAAPIGFESS